MRQINRIRTLRPLHTTGTAMRKFKVREHERGILCEDGVFKVMLDPGRHWFADPQMKIRVDMVSVREPWLRHPELAAIVRSGALQQNAGVIDLNPTQRALVWIDGRFAAALQPGLYALWTVCHDVRVEVFSHAQLNAMLRAEGMIQR